MWVKLEDVGDILDASVQEWLKETNRLGGNQVKLEYDRPNSTWAIESVALEFVRSCEDGEWLADTLLGIFNYEHDRIIDLSSSRQVRMMTDEQAQDMRDALNAAINMQLPLDPLNLENIPGMKELISTARRSLEEQVLHGPDGTIGTVYDGLAADVEKLRSYERGSITLIAHALMNSKPHIREKMIEAKRSGDTRPLSLIKADLEELDKMNAEAETEPEGVEAVDRALRAIDAASRTLESVTEIARKAFNKFLDGTDSEEEFEELYERDRRGLSADQVGVELGLTEETVNVLLTHYGFQKQEPLNETYPLLCSYHPTPLGIVHCKESLVIRCTPEPRFYYQPLWLPTIIDALKTRIER